jgi:type II secretory pathway component PulF
MIDPELAAKLDEIAAKAEAAYQSAEKVRKYILWTGIVTVAAIVLPMIGLALVIPSFISSYVSSLSGASLGI